jgi:hypothetical protein
MNNATKWLIDTYNIVDDTLRMNSGCCLDDENDRDVLLRALIDAFAKN